MDKLSLSEALQRGQLEDFISQEEARGIGPVDAEKLDQALTDFIKQPPETVQASGSPRRGGSSGK